MLLNSHIPVYATCLARKVCGLVRSTWGTSLGGDKLGARDRILNTKVARRARAGHAPGARRANIPPKVPAIVQASMEKLASAIGAGKFGAPFEGVTPCVCAQNAQFLGIFLGPREGKPSQSTCPLKYLQHQRTVLNIYYIPGLNLT